jgi:hypothetical protein
LRDRQVVDQVPEQDRFRDVAAGGVDGAVNRDVLDVVADLARFELDPQTVGDLEAHHAAEQERGILVDPAAVAGKVGKLPFDVDGKALADFRPDIPALASGRWPAKGNQPGARKRDRSQTHLNPSQRDDKGWPRPPRPSSPTKQLKYKGPG